MPDLPLHPRNLTFDWQPAPRLGGRLTAAEAEQFEREGYVLVRAAFDPDEVEAAVAAIDPFERQREEFLRQQADGKFFISRADEITFTAHLAAQSEVLATMSRAEVIRDLCLDLIGPDVRLYWDQAVFKKPGTQVEFPWHQDNGYTFIEPQQYLTCWVALTDTDETNGCPCVLPAHHRKGTYRHEMTPLGWQCVDSSERGTSVPAAAGDIVVFSSLTPHRTGPNLTDAPRKSYILQYAPDGAVRLDDEGSVTQDDPDRQYLVLQHGRPV